MHTRVRKRSESDADGNSRFVPGSGLRHQSPVLARKNLRAWEVVVAVVMLIVWAAREVKVRHTLSLLRSAGPVGFRLMNDRTWVYRT